MFVISLRIYCWILKATSKYVILVGAQKMLGRGKISFLKILSHIETHSAEL